MNRTKIKGYFAGALAFVTCPCHLLITYPILLSLTVGTALGAWLARNLIPVVVILTVVFVVELVLAYKWLRSDKKNVCATPFKTGEETSK